MSAQPSFLAELQRRHVYKVGAMYCVAGWLLVQVATQVFPFFDISNAAVRWVVLAVVAGLPVALVLAWLFDITPQGIVRTPDASAAGESPAAVSQRHGMDRKLNYVLGTLVLLGLGYFTAERLGWIGARPAAGALDKAIAVLPFENLSDDKANAYFADGIQDEILTRLAGIGELKVISRTSTEKYKSRPDNLKTVAEELGVGRVLEGSVQKAGDKVRVNVQLIDAAADAHLWASTYDRDLKDVFAVESEVSQDIADALKARLSPGEADALASVPTHNAAAYDLFLQAEHIWHQADIANNEPLYLQAEGDYRQALALDPDFALAHAQYAHCRLIHHWFFDKSYSAGEKEAIQASVERALALAPELPQAHLAQAFLRYWGYRDYDTALRDFDQVLRLQPSNADAMRGHSAILRRQGHWEEAAAGFKQAVALAPRDSTFLGEYGITLSFLRRYADADAAFRQGLALNADDARVANYLFRDQLIGLGDTAAARQSPHQAATETGAVFDSLGGDVLNLVGGGAAADLFDRRFDAALADRAPAPTDEPEQALRKQSARVAIQVLAGRRDAARAECQALQQQLQPESQQRPDDALLLSRLAWADICLNQGEAALALLRHTVELLPLGRDAYFGTFYQVGLAQGLAHTGHAEEALQILRQLLSIPAGGVLSVTRLRLDPGWDPLRADPGFQKLLANPPQ